MGLAMSPPIYCSVPDSAGSVVVDASLFTPPSSTTMGYITLVRSITSNLSAANATISLAGYFTLEVPAIFEATGDATDAESDAMPDAAPDVSAPSDAGGGA